RDKERDTVVEKICKPGIGKYENKEILVYGIWGMGGIGKTTLAQLVYHHPKVEQNFPLRCWVYASQKFEVKEIIKNIIESIDRSKCELTQLDTLQGELKKRLTRKKFLIVLDDVWLEVEQKAKWDELSKTLSCGEEGSIVVMTTRSSRTSRMMAKVDELQHELGCLSKDDSWLLFFKFAFAQGRKGDAISVLEPIGREIIEKCSGLPLALKTFGSLMWSKETTRDWEHVKGYEMKKDELIQLWAANGFIPPKEDGEEILNCLVWRSFFQLVDTKNIYANDPYKYKMHDLMHDMALHVMGDDCLVIESTGDKIPNEVFHLSSSCPEFVFSPDDLGNLSSLRSILFFGKRNESRLSQIVNHMYLRCHLLVELPKGLRHMVNLQCLDISYTNALCRLPVGIEELTRLRILSKFPIDKEGGAKIGELGDLDLEGELEIARLENVEGFSEAESANIKCKTNLSVLKLSWTDSYSVRGGYKCDEKEVLEGLEPNPGLKNCECLPPLGRLPNLRVIVLYGLLGLKWFHEDDTNMSGGNPNIFPSLQTLHIGRGSYWRRRRTMAEELKKGLLHCQQGLEKTCLS
ncbi:hypothetical protein M8C21_015145, partial [Ambrosia artemisiifolia]